MCFDPDSSPPIPISGGAVDHIRRELTAADGNRFAAFEAFPDPANAKDAAVVVLPDVRGLYRFYEELAVRFAEQGYRAIAFDYFGRTAGVGTRDDEFPFMDHVRQTTFPGVLADVTACVEHLRQDTDRIYTLGFCFGGSNSWHMAASGLGLAGAVGFYGHPDRDFPPGSDTVISKAGSIDCPVLGLQGGDDPGIPEELSDRLRSALDEAGRRTRSSTASTSSSPTSPPTPGAGSSSSSADQGSIDHRCSSTVVKCSACTPSRCGPRRVRQVVNASLWRNPASCASTDSQRTNSR